MGMEGGGIPVFDGKGYEIWSKKMKTLFISQELWDLVQQGYQGMGGLRENRKKDCKALYLIQQGVSDSIFPVIMKSNTSKEAWEVIRDRFHDQQAQQQQINEIDEEIRTRTTIHMEEMMKNLSPIYPERCIFRVPDALRFGNEKFYEPKVLSIGPYHRGNPRLASMEEHKVRYLQDLLLQMGEQSVDRFVQAIMPHEQSVRKCYEESIESVSSVDLIQMLVLDGCFIIELFRRMVDRRDQHYRWFQQRQIFWHVVFNGSDDDDVPKAKANVNPSDRLFKEDPVIDSDILLNALENDLLLVENQIPFFIIQILYGVIRGGIGDLHIMKLKTLILAFLCRKYLMYEILPQDIINRLNINDMYHLLDIAHKTICHKTKFPIKEDEVVKNSDESIFPSLKDETFCFANSATKLEEANVTLKPSRVSFGNSIFNISFSKGKLTIPSIDIEYHLEVDIRNFIALELCQKDRKKRYYCDYVVFMDHLIASTDDVELLIHRGIIKNQMIDANFVDNMFKRLTKNIVRSDPYTYYQISKELNDFCDRPRNKWSASFKQKYCQSPWTFISILAASTLLALTITQTLYSILSYAK